MVLVGQQSTCLQLGVRRGLVGRAYHLMNTGVGLHHAFLGLVVMSNITLHLKQTSEPRIDGDLRGVDMEAIPYA